MSSNWSWMGLSRKGVGWPVPIIFVALSWLITEDKKTRRNAPILQLTPAPNLWPIINAKNGRVARFRPGLC